MVAALTGMLAMLGIVNRSMDNVPSYSVVAAGSDADATVAVAAALSAPGLGVRVDRPLDIDGATLALRELTGFMGLVWQPGDALDDDEDVPNSRDVRLGLNEIATSNAAVLLHRTIASALGGAWTLRPLHLDGTFPMRPRILVRALLAEGPLGRLVILLGWSD